MTNPSWLIGAHVAYTGLLVDRTILGEVRGIDYSTGALRLKVRYFNGDPWPFDPLKPQVDILSRDEDHCECGATGCMTCDDAFAE